MTERCLQLSNLLKGLQSSASSEDSAKITELLEAVEEDTTDFRITSTHSNPDTDIQDSMDSVDQRGSDDHAELDTRSLDLLDEDLHHEGARATGFIGKNSEIQWLRTVAITQSDRGDDTSLVIASRRGSLAFPMGDQVSSFSYWADSEHVDVDFLVDAYDFPQTEVAERLLQFYMSRVHDSFPILPRKTFEDQFRMYFTAVQNGKAPRLSPKWQSILNLVFAIGARYSHLVKAPWRADERDHLVYQARARSLGLNEAVITSHPDLPQIQSLGLMAFYWLSTGQVSRAWNVIGVALRSAYSLGLHVRNEDPAATTAKRETLVRTWWSLYSLERTLGIITGRPSIIVDSCCSVPLPIPLPEDRLSDELDSVYHARKQSTSHHYSNPSYDTPVTPTNLKSFEANSGSYFKAVIQLSILTQNILTSLYSVGTMIRSPSEIQHDVSQLNQRLDQWSTSLPQEFNFQQPHQYLHNSQTPLARERTLLAFQFCSARMLLGRPYLSNRSSLAREHTEETFATRMANACIEAAKTVIHYLSDDYRPELLYDQGPWWCVVHHLMQAISVFLLGLSFPSATTQESRTLINYTRKAIRWLNVVQDPLAERASKVAVTSFAHVARRHAIDISDLWPMNSTYRYPIQGHGNDGMDLSRLRTTGFTGVQQGYAQQVSPIISSGMDYGGYNVVAAEPAYPVMERSQGIADEGYHVAR